MPLKYCPRPRCGGLLQYDSDGHGNLVLCCYMCGHRPNQAPRPRRLFPAVSQGMCADCMKVVVVGRHKRCQACQRRYFAKKQREWYVKDQRRRGVRVGGEVALGGSRKKYCSARCREDVKNDRKKKKRNAVHPSVRRLLAVARRARYQAWKEAVPGR